MPWWDACNHDHIVESSYLNLDDDLKTNSILSITDIVNLLQSNVEEISREYISLKRRNVSIRDTLKTTSGSMGEWNAYYLMEEGMWHQPGCTHTMSILKLLPICESSLGYVYFSVLSPGTSIEPHCGATNAKLRVHLPLKPPDSECFSDCSITVNGEERQYCPGKVMIFDDSFEHSVANRGSADRVVLLVDIWHPTLARSPSALQAITHQFVPMRNCNEIRRPAATTATSTTSSSSSPSPSSSAAAAADEAHFSQLPTASRTAIEGRGDYDYVLKILLIGDYGAGKSSFVTRWAHDRFSDGYVSTIGVDFMIRSLPVRNCVVKVQMWDPAGPERFGTVTRSYFRGAHIVLVLVDLTDPASSFLSKAEFHLEQVRLNVSETTTIALVGTKADLLLQPRPGSESSVCCEQAQAFASSRGVVYWPSSSKTGQGVHSTVREVVRAHLLRGLEAGNIKVISPPSPTKKEPRTARPSWSKCVLS